MKLLTALTILLFCLFTGCSNDHEKQAAHEDNSHTSHASMETGEPSDHSIYHAGSTWLNRNGEEVALEDLSGKVQVVAMVYTYCEFACPRILADLKRIESSLTDVELKNTNFLIVSIDPERDTPDRLTSFAEENNLSSRQWTLLNGNEGDILELAALLGVKYKRISEEDFSHSNIITVLNKDGEVAHRQEKIGDQPTNTIRAIKNLAE